MSLRACGSRAVVDSPSREPSRTSNRAERPRPGRNRSEIPSPPARASRPAAPTSSPTARAGNLAIRAKSPRRRPCRESSTPGSERRTTPRTRRGASRRRPACREAAARTGLAPRIDSAGAGAIVMFTSAQHELACGILLRIDNLDRAVFPRHVRHVIAEMGRRQQLAEVPCAVGSPRNANRRPADRHPPDRRIALDKLLPIGRALEQRFLDVQQFGRRPLDVRDR